MEQVTYLTSTILALVVATWGAATTPIMWSASLVLASMLITPPRRGRLRGPSWCVDTCSSRSSELCTQANKNKARVHYIPRAT